VTISRQLGSGGDEIGQAVARELGAPYLDREIIRLTAERVGLTDLDAIDPERRQGALRRLIPLLALGEVAAAGRVAVDPTAPPEAVASAVYRQMMTEVIRELAAGGQAVIVGRGGQVILASTPGVLHVAIGAAPAARAERLARQRGLDPAAAERVIAASDEARAAFLRAEHGVDWQSPALYDLVIATDRLPAEAATAAIVAAARALAARTHGGASERRLRQERYTVAEAAELLMLNPEVLRHAIHAGALPAARAGKAIIAIRRQDLLGWLEREAAMTHH
jgi:excisionase family DNA binding protein